MDNQHSRSLIPWAIRSHRRGMLSVGLGFGLLVLILGPSYVAAAKAVGGGLKQLAAVAQPIAESFQFLTGPVERLDTVGGYLSYKIFPDIALLVAVYAAIQGSQIIRGSETKGMFDLWLAAGRSRNAILRDRVVGLLVSLLAIVGFVYIGTAAGGALSGMQLVGPGLGQCVAVGLVALFAFSLGLLLSQFFQTSRAASAITSTFLVATFFIANMNDSLGPLTFLRYLSPFYYYIQARTLVPGISFDVAAMAVLLAAAVVATGVACLLFQRRDIGGVSLARVHGTKEASHDFRPSRIWRRWLWISWITEQLLGIVSWVVGIAAFTTVEAAVVPSALKLVKDNGQFSKFLARHGGVLTTDQYLSFFLTFTALLVAGFTVYQVSRWASDAAQHRVDVLLIQPVSMWRLLVERAASLVAMAVVVGLAVVAGTSIGAAIGGFSVNGDGLLRTFADIVLLCFAIGGFGLLATTIFRSGAATGATAGLLVASFFLTTLTGLLSWPAWTNRPSVFNAFGTPYLSLPDVGSLIYLAVLGVGGVVISYVAMRRGMRVAD
jgi:ABC-2 type transport system permease protein